MESSFEFPCCVRATVSVPDGSGNRRTVHQLHVCLPVGDGQVRVLNRVSVDFWQWTSYVPWIRQFPRDMAEKVELLSGLMTVSWQMLKEDAGMAEEQQKSLP